MPAKTPVENLYNVGDGVSDPGAYGLVNAAESAQIVARELIEKLCAT
jgi:hypothetical protein